VNSLPLALPQCQWQLQLEVPAAAAGLAGRAPRRRGFNFFTVVTRARRIIRAG